MQCTLAPPSTGSIFTAATMQPHGIITAANKTLALTAFFHHCFNKKTSIDRGRTDRISLTQEPSSPASYGQQSVGSETDGGDCSTSHANAIGNYTYRTSCTPVLTRNSQTTLVRTK